MTALYPASADRGQPASRTQRGGIPELTLGPLQDLAGNVAVLEDAKLHHVRVALALRRDVLERTRRVRGQRHGDARRRRRARRRHLAVGMRQLVRGSRREAKGERDPGAENVRRRVQVRHVAQHARPDLVPVKGLFVVHDGEQVHGALVVELCGGGVRRGGQTMGEGTDSDGTHPGTPSGALRIPFPSSRSGRRPRGVSSFHGSPCCFSEMSSLIWVLGSKGSRSLV